MLLPLEWERMGEAILKDIIAECFPELITNLYSQIPHAQFSEQHKWR
jgi:hypothetical protein